MQVNMHGMRCRRRLPVIACEVAYNGCGLSFFGGTTVVAGGDAVARERWADPLSDLPAGLRYTTAYRLSRDITPKSEQNRIDICVDIMYMVEHARPSL
jgi:hypothetical protein